MNKDKLILLTGKPYSSKKSIFSHLTRTYYYNKKSEILIGKYKDYIIFNMPDIYSITSSNKDETIFRDILMFDDIYRILFVSNINKLESDLYLLLQILEFNKNIILCIDIYNNESLIDTKSLESILGIPIIIFNSKDYKSIKKLISNIDINITSDFELKYSDALECHIEHISNLLNIDNIYKRNVSIKLLEGDKSIVKSFKDKLNINILTTEINDYLRNIIFREVIKEISLSINKECKKIKEKVVVEKQKELVYKSYSILNAFLLSLLIIFIFLISKTTSLLINNNFNIFFSYIYFLLSSFIVSYIFNFIYNYLFNKGLIHRLYFSINSVFKKSKILPFIFGLGYIYDLKYIEDIKEKKILSITKYLMPNYFIVLILTILFDNILFVFSILTLYFFLFSMVNKILSYVLYKNTIFYTTYEMPPLKSVDYYLFLKESFFQTEFLFLKIFKYTFIPFILIVIFLNTYISGYNIMYYVIELIKTIFKT